MTAGGRRVRGRHLLVEFSGCPPERIATVERLRPVMVDAVERCGATALSWAFHQFEPVGATGVVLLAESHLAFHSWPEDGYLAMDVFTCGDAMDPRVAVEAVAEAVGAARTEVRSEDRGPR